MVICGIVLHRNQIVERRLRWVIGAASTGEVCQVLRGNPSENGANFGKFRLCWLDQVTYKMSQRLTAQIRRSLKHPMQK